VPWITPPNWNAHSNLQSRAAAAPLKDILYQLRSEGYSTGQITGKTLAKQLRALIEATRTVTGPKATD
jgi:hypothetical protein